MIKCVNPFPFVISFTKCILAAFSHTTSRFLRA